MFRAGEAFIPAGPRGCEFDGLPVRKKRDAGNFGGNDATQHATRKLCDRPAGWPLWTG